MVFDQNMHFEIRLNKFAFAITFVGSFFAFLVSYSEADANGCAARHGTSTAAQLAETINCLQDKMFELNYLGEDVGRYRNLIKQCRGTLPPNARANKLTCKLWISPLHREKFDLPKATNGQCASHWNRMGDLDRQLYNMCIESATNPLIAKLPTPLPNKYARVAKEQADTVRLYEKCFRNCVLELDVEIHSSTIANAGMDGFRNAYRAIEKEYASSKDQFEQAANECDGYAARLEDLAKNDPNSDAYLYVHKVSCAVY